MRSNSATSTAQAFAAARHGTRPLRALCSRLLQQPSASAHLERPHCPQGSQVLHFGSGHAARAAGQRCTCTIGQVCAAGAEKSGDIGLAESLHGPRVGPRPDLSCASSSSVHRQPGRDRVGRCTAAWWGAILAYRLQATLLNGATRGGVQPAQHPRALRPGQRRSTGCGWIETMNYSSALVRRPASPSPLAEAQLTPRWGGPCSECRVCRPATRVLEIGCGWGAVAERGGARLRRPRDGRDPLDTNSSPGRSERLASPRPGAPGRPAPAGLPRHHPQPRPSDAL